MDDRISIAIVTYNGAGYLREQLDSIYAQTLLPYEVVAVDDASQDNTAEILEEYRRRYGLKYEVNPINLGVNRNMERAIRLCTGDYIALCDQDDVWMPHKIETCYDRLRKIENGKAALVASASIIADADLTPKAAQRRREADSCSYLTFLSSHHAQGCTLMINRALLTHVLPFPPQERMIFDYYLGLAAAMNANVSFIGEPLLYYRRHAHNTSGHSSGKPSLLQRFCLRYRNRYPGFIRDRQFGLIRTVVEYQGDRITGERRVVCAKILALDGCEKFMRGLKLLWSFREFSLGRRCLVVGEFILSGIFNAVSPGKAGKS